MKFTLRLGGGAGKEKGGRGEEKEGQGKMVGETRRREADKARGENREREGRQEALRGENGDIGRGGKKGR